MVNKTKKAKINKQVAKDLAVPAKETKKKRRYVALRNVDKLKKEGWKQAKESKDKHNRTLGVNTNINEGSQDNTADLILMEK